MKIKDLTKMVIAIVAIVVLVVLFCNANLNFDGLKNWFTKVTTTEVETKNDQQLVSNVTPTPMPTDNAVTPEATQKLDTVFTDENGKTYFSNSEEAYQNVSLQVRLDYAEIVNYHVYDVLANGGDEIVKDTAGNEITSRYGIDIAQVKSVAFLRDGYTVLAYSYDEGEFRKDSESHEFKGAKDQIFASEVFCTEHSAIKATTRVGYINATVWGLNGQYGCKGNFEVKFLDGGIFDAIVLVKRAVVVNGTTMYAYTWCMRTCSNDQDVIKEPADGGNGNGGNKPSDKPTVEPTVKPTAEPTVEPTVKPTHSPTEAPQPTQQPSYKPTHSPTEAPQPTQQPSYKPTPVPEVTPEPTNRHSDTGDGGSGNNHSPVDDDTSTDEGTSGGNRHSDASDTGSGNRHSEP